MGTKKTLEERITALESRLTKLTDFCRSQQFVLEILMKESNKERIRELEAKVEDLHATDSARRLNMATEDPEWY